MSGRTRVDAWLDILGPAGATILTIIATAALAFWAYR